MPPPSSPDPRLLGDFFISADATLGALAEIYGPTLDPTHAGTSLADHFARELGRPSRRGDVLRLGEVLLIAHKVVAGRVTQVGLQLAEPDTTAKRPAKPAGRIKSAVRRGVAFVIGRAEAGRWTHRQVRSGMSRTGCRAPLIDDAEERVEPVGQRRRSGLQDQRRLDLAQEAGQHRRDLAQARAATHLC